MQSLDTSHSSFDANRFECFEGNKIGIGGWGYLSNDKWQVVTDLNRFILRYSNRARARAS